MRVAKAARPRDAMVYDVAGFYVDMYVRLKRQWSFNFHRSEYIGRKLPLGAALQTFARSDQPVGAHHHVARLEESPLAVDAERTAVLARSLGVGNIAKSIDDDRIFALEDLGRNRAVGTEIHRCNAVDAILVGSATPSTKEQVHEKEMAAVELLTAEMQYVATLTGDPNPVGQGFGERPENNVKHPEEKRCAAAYRGRIARIYYRALGRDDFDWTGKSDIGKHVGTDYAFDRSVDRTARHPIRHVDGGLCLGRRPGEVDGERISLDSDCDPNRHGHALGADAVIFERVFLDIFAGLDRANRGARCTLGVSDEIGATPIENLETVFFDDRLDLLFTAAASGNLSLDVAHPFLGRTHVGFEHLQQCVVTHAALV